MFGTGTLVLKGDGVLTLSGSVTFREAAQMTMEANVFSEGATVSVPSGITLTLQNLGTCKCAITGAGAVKTVGDVQFTQTSSFTGGLTVTSGTASTTTQKGFGGVDNNTTAGSVTVADGGCVDVANTKDRCYSFTITGKGVATTDASGTTTYSGAMTNTGSAIPTSAMQAKSITLAGDALITVASGHGWGLLYQGYNATTLNFAGYTLTKQGDGDFFICNVTTSSSGAIAVKEGTFSTVQRASTLSGSSIRMFGNSTLRLDQTLDGLTSLDLYPAVGGVTLTSLGNLASSTTITLKGSYLDGNDIEAGAETVTLITGTENTITNGLIASSNITLGGRFSGITYDDNGTTLTATLCSFPTKFFHYDFNGSSVSATDSKATDSQYQLGAFTGAPSVVAKGRTGSSGWIKNQATPYWNDATSSTSPLDSCGVLTVTTVARLPFATGNPSPLWCLGTVHGQNAVIILRVVDADTVAAVAIDVGTSQTSVGRELASVTGIKNLTTAFHFFALVITPDETRLYVDRMDPVVAKGAGAPTTGMTNCGQFGAIFGGTNVYTQNLGTTGFYLDDFQVYDAILSDTEIQALRREFCPDPFFILVK